jgi:hypothetical protein
MNRVLRSALLAALASLAAASAWATDVTVKFANSTGYSDMPFHADDRAEVLKELELHFNKLAKRLPEGTRLTVEVLDLDLAGRILPNFRANDIRLLKGGADWPHMHVRYTIERDGKVVATGEDHLSNMAYLDRSNRYMSGDPLRYEKQMVDDWFKEKIAAR